MRDEVVQIQLASWKSQLWGRMYKFFSAKVHIKLRDFCIFTSISIFILTVLGMRNKAAHVKIHSARTFIIKVGCSFL